MTRIKICGVTTEEDAALCVALGVDAIGVNFVPSSPRCVSAARGRAIARAAAGLLVVGVVADLAVDEAKALAQDAGLGCLQLHGRETPVALSALLPHAYKAVRIGADEDVRAARAYPGEYLLVDAKVEGMLGGSGATFDWSLVRELATERKLVLAGGLVPENVAAAIDAVAPWCVDVASGVESAPGVKDHARVRAFVDAVRRRDRNAR